MSRRIPPLNPLRVFEVVARTGNLTLAAKELNVSQSATSRQVHALESYLGIELFRRERYGVSLTRTGRLYADQVIPAFAEIAAATEKLLRGARQDALRVRSYQTFAAKWLIPHLPEFRRLHPQIEVRILSAVSDVDFDRDPVDVAIQFGDGRWPRVAADLLFEDVIEPVCSPRYLAEQTRKKNRPGQLLRDRLLLSRYRKDDWDDWLSATGHVADAEAAERMSFGSSVLTWQAALDSLGIAIGQSTLLTSEFAAGTLVRPFASPITRPKAHYIVRPVLQRESRKVGAFRDWLLASFGQRP